MEDRFTSMLSQILNDQQHIRRFLEFPCPFTQNQKQQVKSINAKVILKGHFFNFNKEQRQFQNYYFELFPNVLMRYQDKHKNGQGEAIILQYFYCASETEKVDNIQIYSIIIEGELGFVKLMTDKQNSFQLWQQEIQKFCKLRGFLQRYKVENRIYEHFYKCVDKRKKNYAIAKIVSKKGSKCVEQKKFVENEVTIIRKVQCALLPHLKKIYEDDNYIYLTFQFFRGDDLLKISQNSKLEEIAVATLAYHILKGLKALHNQGYYHGNLKLENIIFSTSKKDNEIFIINFKFTEEKTENYREKMIKKGNNLYVAPEVLEQKPYDQQIDIFSLGVCLFQMVFKKSPYIFIEKDKYENKYNFELDLSILYNMKKEKKRDVNSKQLLSASGIDFFLNLLKIDPKSRPSAAQAMNHSWFINFTNRDQKQKYGMKSQGQNNQNQNSPLENDMMSLRTIIESSECEREYTLISGGSKILKSGIMGGNTSNFLTFMTQAQDVHDQQSDDDIFSEEDPDNENEDDEDDGEKICNDEYNGVEYKINQLNQNTQHNILYNRNQKQQYYKNNTFPHIQENQNNPNKNNHPNDTNYTSCSSQSIKFQQIDALSNENEQFSNQNQYQQQQKQK